MSLPVDYWFFNSALVCWRMKFKFKFKSNWLKVTGFDRLIMKKAGHQAHMRGDKNKQEVRTSTWDEGIIIQVHLPHYLSRAFLLVMSIMSYSRHNVGTDNYVMSNWNELEYYKVEKFKYKYGWSPSCDHSHKRPALVMTTFVKPCLNCDLTVLTKSSHKRLLLKVTATTFGICPTGFFLYF